MYQRPNDVDRFIKFLTFIYIAIIICGYFMGHCN
jgi:hypothetical protein